MDGTTKGCCDGDNAAQQEQHEVIALRSALEVSRSQLRTYKDQVRKRLVEAYEDGGFDADRRAFNGVLDDLGLERIAVAYTATVTATVDVEFETTADEHEIHRALEDLSFSGVQPGLHDPFEEFSLNYVRAVEVTDLDES